MHDAIAKVPRKDPDLFRQAIRINGAWVQAASGRTNPCIGTTGRRALLALGTASTVSLVAPPGASARPGSAAMSPGISRGLWSAQAQAASPVLVPAFDRDRLALLRALLASPAFQASLAGAAGATPPAVATDLRADLARVRRVVDAFFAIAAPRLTAAGRRDLAPDDGLAGWLEDMPIASPTARVIARGTDVVDRLTQWLSLAVEVSKPASSAGPDHAAVFTALRPQVLQGYATTPALATLDAAGRHDLAVWVSLNLGFTLRTVMASAFASPGSDASRAEAALQGRMRTTLRDLGLNVDALRLNERGLRRT